VNQHYVAGLGATRERDRFSSPARFERPLVEANCSALSIVELLLSRLHTIVARSRP
jgi:hypothetical protein